MTSSISRARPTTGSSPPSRASAVRFRPSWARSGKASGSSSQGSPSAGATTRSIGAGAAASAGAGPGSGKVASASPSESTSARGDPSGSRATVVDARGGTGAGRAGERASRGPNFRGIRPLRK